MKALPTQKRALLKRIALIDAAAKEFSTVGYEIATAKSIAAQAEVATGTFYQYFDNKGEILRVIATQRIEELQNRLNWVLLQETSELRTIEQVFKQNLEFTYEFHSSNTELHQVLEQRRDLDDQLKVIMDKGDAVLYGRTLELVKSFNVDKPDVVAQNLHESECDTNEVLSVGAKMLACFFSPS